MSHELVSIKREKIDGNKIQGFIIDESGGLILVSYVYDFNLDGLMVLRKKDITKLETTKTDKLLLEVINGMPKWKPAENAKGVKVKQDFEFIGGFMVGC